jgi:HAD superfamily hydrolase (TIGR01549 family)
MPLAAVVFDFDNTLVPTSGIADAAVAAILRRYGCELAEGDLRSVIRRSRNDHRLIRSLLRPAFVTPALEAVRQANLDSLRAIQSDERIMPLLETLAERYALYIYSGRDSLSLEIALRETGIAKVLAGVATDESGRGKPSPAALRRLLLRTGRSGCETVYVGDLLTDYWTALNAGCSFIGATWFHDRLPASIRKCDDPAFLPVEIERMSLEPQRARTRSWSEARRVVCRKPNSGYSRKPSP